MYQKTDDPQTESGTLDVQHVIFVDKRRTADYQTTRGLRKILENDGNTDDLIAFMYERNLPIDDIEANKIAETLLGKPPRLGYLTISNALKWRLQYRRVIVEAGEIDGVLRIW